MDGPTTPCEATALAAATFTSSVRVVNRAHYATDVLVGVGTGALIGVGLPYLLHDGRTEETERRATVVPFIAGDATGVSLRIDY